MTRLQLQPPPADPSARARHILGAYRLETDGKIYRATSWFQGRVMSSIEHDRLECTIAEARCQWGHFNFRDEAEAFATIFPPVHTLQESDR